MTSHVYGVGRISSSGPGGSRYHHGDDRGSVTDTTDAQGVATFRASYDGFGRTTSSEVLRPGSSVPAFGYVGQQRDGDGTYHLRARQYDADLGRFTAQDPAGALAGDPYVTSYGYGLLRPTLYVDASGLCVFCLETVRGFSGALGDVAGATAAFGFGVGAVASGATLLCPVCAPVTGTVAAVSFGVAGVASATALATGAINSSIDCYQSANGYAPVVDGASCAGSLVDTALNYGFGRGARYLNDAAWFRRGPFAGPLRDSGRATRRNVGGAVNGSVEVAGYGFGRGIQRLYK